MRLVDIIMPTNGTGRCRLRAYRPSLGMVVAIFSELADNPGPSVANCIEELATDIRRGQMRQGEVLITIVHHEFDGRLYLDREGTFEFVKMRWDARSRRYHAPTWELSSRERLEALIGEPLEGVEA